MSKIPTRVGILFLLMIRVGEVYLITVYNIGQGKNIVITK